MCETVVGEPSESQIEKMRDIGWRYSHTEKNGTHVFWHGFVGRIETKELDDEDIENFLAIKPAISGRL